MNDSKKGVFLKGVFFTSPYAETNKKFFEKSDFYQQAPIVLIENDILKRPPRGIFLLENAAEHATSSLNHPRSGNNYKAYNGRVHR